MLKIKQFTVNPLQENCYVLSTDSGEALVIDDGAYYPEEKQAIEQYITEHHLTLLRQLQTHAHFDHLWGAMDLYEKFHAKVSFHPADEALYYNVPAQLKAIIGREMKVSVPPKDAYLQEGEQIALGDYRFRVIATPGHTPGGVCFYEEKEKILFSGDSLFRGSIGRTDFEGGSLEALVGALKQHILTLPQDVVVYPGHGPSTTIAYELENNYYLCH